MTKPTKWLCAQQRLRSSLGIRPVWLESLLCTQWVAENPSFLHADSEDSDQTGRMPRLIWVFAVHSVGSLQSKLSSCGPRWLWSDWADAQADLSLGWVHISFCWFCHEAAHLRLITHVFEVYYFVFLSSVSWEQIVPIYRIFYWHLIEKEMHSFFYCYNAILNGQ